MEKTILTNMCMIYNGTRVVVQDRVGDNWTGIAFPGGHVEDKESFTDAVIREIYEETGLTISHPKLCGIKNWFRDDGTRYIVLLYKTDEFSGTLKDSAEGEVFWAELSEFKSMDLASGMTELIDCYTHEDISELYYVLDGTDHRCVIK
ncbi:MAG: 8-oxo-dGTP diphosphatase [Ruminococcaceae bacterium]|nr:8-oxo-dGTP diphosphatase [Oscillospiraceae bacterium]